MPQTQNKQKKVTPSLTKDKNARRFLTLLLLLIFIFISSVCIVINKRNNDIISGGTIGETDKAVTDSQKKENTPDVPVVATDDNETTAPQTSIKEEATKPVFAQKAGTIDNPAIIDIDEENWFLTLVNSGYRIPDSYSADLVYVCSSQERLDSKVAKHYEKMFNDAKKDGINLTPCSGYRSYETQERNYNNKISYYESLGYTNTDAKIKAATIIMPPGSSEHNLGYAMDIVCVDEWFEDTDEFKWLQENAADYGFILRYPKDKQDITKVTYEPWHWRYVGVTAAKEMKKSGQVLEEYLGVNAE